MVMASLAWSLKAWNRVAGSSHGPRRRQPPSGKTDVVADGVRDVPRAFIEMPCQIIRGARRLIYRLLSWNPWQGMFLRLVERLQSCWLC